MNNRLIQVTPTPCLVREGKRKHRDHRRVVTFQMFSRVHEIPTIDEMSDREIASLWQTPEDAQRHQDDLVKCISAARKNPFDATICTRGIERLMDPTAVLRLRVCRKNLIDAVLDNQEEQWRSGLYHANSEEIRSIANKITRQSIEAAIALAAKDEAYVCIMRRKEKAKAPSFITTDVATISATDKTEESKDQNGITKNIN